MMAMHPTGNFIYVANIQSNSISAYAVKAVGGTLTRIAGSPFAAGTKPYALAVDPGGRFLYAANAASKTISAYAIDPVTGRLTPAGEVASP
jgi:6-phosphogluconolactonase (cycloisomerase 2 family)